MNFQVNADVLYFNENVYQPETKYYVPRYS